MIVSEVLIIFILFISAFLGEAFLIKVFRERKISQVMKSYGPQSHIIQKRGTPSMGGILFMLIAVFSITLFSSIRTITVVRGMELWLLPLGCACIGLADDWLKYRNDSSEGLSSIRKFTAQLVLSVPWSIWFFHYHGIAWWPGLAIESPTIGIFLLVFVCVGIMNAVNVTDGLDGLATGCMILSLSSALLLLHLPGDLSSLVITGLVISISFLWYNAHPALVFMGDVGSHFFAGLILVCCIYSGYFLALIPLCFLFGLEILSVSIQLLAIHLFKKKVFLMSPFHHHFELKGWSESQIVHRFWIIHGIGIFSLMTMFHFILQ
ncbi:MAG: phospho-N-acetylmuramoyl-pentapeptide-transferase [Synergistales bacterium]|nr:phospho-N-acetylmuramoyl-pentapeptide-transferase [Synergistales bacterium]